MVVWKRRRASWWWSSGVLLQVRKQLGFLQFFVPLDGELMKEVFNGETAGNVKQSGIPSFGMVYLTGQLQWLASDRLCQTCCPSLVTRFTFSYAFRLKCTSLELTDMYYCKDTVA